MAISPTRLQPIHGVFMLVQRSISIGSLIFWSGITLGLVLMILGQFLIDDLARWGLAVMMLACTYSVHRSLSRCDDHLRQAFDMGREHEGGRVQSIR